MWRKRSSNECFEKEQDKYLEIISASNWLFAILMEHTWNYFGSKLKLFLINIQKIEELLN